jgi:hypothetical protein
MGSSEGRVSEGLEELYCDTCKIVLKGDALQYAYIHVIAHEVILIPKGSKPDGSFK